MKHRMRAEIKDNYLILYIPMRVATYLELPADPDAPILFTGRQQDIFELLLRGKQHKEIAEELRISVSASRESTVKIYKKCGVRDRTELILKFLQAPIHRNGDGRTPTPINGEAGPPTVPGKEERGDGNDP